MTEKENTKNKPDIKTEHFEGPLDLLCYLIEKNEINIYDIPIITITDQYLEYMEGMDGYDLESTSSFVVMASTLLHIKSKMLLPRIKSADEGRENDPREELVIKLLEYRRCKALAQDLREKHKTYRDCIYKMPEPPKSLGVKIFSETTSISVEEFYKACKILTQRNLSRFNDVTTKMIQILRREKISLKDKMKKIWTSVCEKSKVVFNEIFPPENTEKPERVVGFLALLELLRINKITALQNSPFEEITIKMKKTGKKIKSADFGSQFANDFFEEINYK